MIIGIPKKKAQFELLRDGEVWGDCYLDGKNLYFLTCNDSLGAGYLLKMVDLDEFDGNEAAVPPIYEDKRATALVLAESNGALILRAGLNTVVEKSTGKLILSEFTQKVSSDWRDSFSSFIQGRIYYRQIDKKSPDLGVDIYDVEAEAFLGHLNVDIRFPQHIGDSLLIGNRVNGNYAVFSTVENKYILEIDFEEYFGERAAYPPFYSWSQDRLVIAYNSKMLFIDLKNMVIDALYDLADFSLVRDILEKYKTNPSRIRIAGVDLIGDMVVVHGSQVCPFVLQAGLRGKKLEVSWIYTQWHEVVAKYKGGGLIFGIEASQPIAWDAFTGEKVWEASATTIANKVQIGDAWVVYSHLSGNVQCFHAASPYVSPHGSA